MNKTVESTPKKKRNPTPLRVHTPVHLPRVSTRSESPRPISLGSSQEGFSPRARRQRRRDEYSVDNVVIPSSSIPVSPRVPKNIITPSWTEIGEIDIAAALIKATEEQDPNKVDAVDALQGEVPITTTIHVEEDAFLQQIEEQTTCSNVQFVEHLDSLKSDLGNSSNVFEQDQPKGFSEPSDDIKDSNSSRDPIPKVRLLSDSKDGLELDTMSSDVSNQYLLMFNIIRRIRQMSYMHKDIFVENYLRESDIYSLIRIETYPLLQTNYRPIFLLLLYLHQK